MTGLPPAIEVDRVSKTFWTGSPLPFLGPPRREIRALSEVSLRVQTGEVFGLVGRNGYGKTTLIKCIASLIQPSEGSVRVLGHDSVKDGRALRRELGLVSAEERTFYFRLNGYQNLSFFGRLQGLDARAARRRTDELAELFDVKALLPRPFHEYSTGNRQRLAILRALLPNPRLLVLDEPTRSLDPFAAASLRRVLGDWIKQAADRAVLITTHNLNEVEELSDRVGIMSRGRLRAQGTLSELRQKHGSYEQIEIDVERPATGEVLSTLERHAPDLRCEKGPEKGFVLSFRRTKDDTALDAVLRVVVNAELGIASFRRSELGLQDIVDRIDAEAANDA